MNEDIILHEVSYSCPAACGSRHCTIIHPLSLMLAAPVHEPHEETGPRNVILRKSFALALNPTYGYG